ncbi:hypothetical protein KP509_23G018300 [Ceratopteris richardii]|uniref:Gnk2-homologous domain-containing protein n=1 Tax=Ceratopteris richardii TaxID=49495 RepID=A0A8T2S0B9_CERRI|nr:hypothetical protein KP509_23G018300 [Ceratopteris richardii]
MALVICTVGDEGSDGHDGSDPAALVYAKCNSKRIVAGSAFWQNLGTTLRQVAENTAYADYDFHTQNGGWNAPAFARGSCDTQALSAISTQDDCTDCLTNLPYRIWSICNAAIGAEVKLAGCALRYEQYRFW